MTQVLIGFGITLVAAWLVLAVFLVVARPRGTTVTDAARILPDVIRLLRRLAADKSLARGVRVRLWVLLGYLAFPIDLVPDFLPVIGYADDVIITLVVVRSVVRRAGPSALDRHWPGTDAGLASLLKLARIDPRTRDDESTVTMG
ncbi:MAG: YkvA family protein [Acidimicrobiia bacterium]